MDYTENYTNLTPEQQAYIRRLANRLVRLRKSSSIDADDLASAAAIRWWRHCLRVPEGIDPSLSEISFRQQVKFAMRDVLRESAPVKTTRAYQAKLKAYETPYTVSLDHAIDISAGEEHPDLELWLDVVAGVNRLAPREQTILSLAVEYGYSFTEIAYAMDVSVSTITRAYHRALQSIRENLSDSQKARKK